MPLNPQTMLATVTVVSGGDGETNDSNLAAEEDDRCNVTLEHKIPSRCPQKSFRGPPSKFTALQVAFKEGPEEHLRRKKLWPRSSASLERRSKFQGVKRFSKNWFLGSYRNIFKTDFKHHTSHSYILCFLGRLGVKCKMIKKAWCVVEEKRGRRKIGEIIPFVRCAMYLTSMESCGERVRSGGLSMIIQCFLVRRQAKLESNNQPRRDGI